MLIYKRLFCWVILALGLILTSINIYGLTQNVRVNDFSNEYLRFVDDQPIPFQQAITAVKRLPQESDIAFANRVTEIVSKGISHIEWLDFPVEQFNQLVPIWENYFLYFMGTLTDIPEFKRYQFANYERSLKRGIGICGDASMILSQILDEQNIHNKILTFPGHVVVLATFNSGIKYILDADFGVVVPYEPEQLAVNHSDIAKLYVDAGYGPGDYSFFKKMYTQSFKSWNGVEHFITKKYYFEMISYWLKWPLPIGMILFSYWLLFRKRKTCI